MTIEKLAERKVSTLANQVPPDSVPAVVGRHTSAAVRGLIYGFAATAATETTIQRVSKTPAEKNRTTMRSSLDPRRRSEQMQARLFAP